MPSEKHASPMPEAVATDTANCSKRRSKRIRESQSKSATPSQSMGGEDTRDADGVNSSMSPRKVPCTGGPALRKSIPDSVSDQLQQMHKSDPDDSNNDHVHALSKLDEVLTALTSRIEKEVLAVCGKAGKGGQIVPSIFNQFRPPDWNSTETIDLLDE